MFFREYHHAGRDELWGIWYTPISLATHRGTGITAFDFLRRGFSSTYSGGSAEGALEGEAERQIRAKKRAGFRETPRSLSRRWFELRDAGHAKFWIVELDDYLVAVHFGRVPQSPWYTDAGQRKFKEFPTPEKAQAYYAKMIRTKIEAGYVEVYPRPESG